MLATLVLGSLLPALVSPPAAGALRIAGRVEAPAAGGGAAAIAATFAALGGARVELLPAVLDYAATTRRLAGEAAGPPLAATRADRTGAFQLAAPGAGCYRVVVRADGYLPVELALVPLVADRELPAARLTPAVPIVVRALGPRDEPLAGVAVALQRAYEPRAYEQEADGESWRPAERFGRTGANGRVTLSIAAGETPHISVLDPRFLGAAQWLGDPAATGGARPGETVLRLKPHPELTLTLAALAPGGRGVGGALLRLEDGSPIAVAGSDARLRISFDEPPGLMGRQAPTLESPGGELRGDVSWALARGGSLRVTLGPWRETAGRLTDAEDGHALAGGVVWAERTGGLDGAWVLAAATAAARSRAWSWRSRAPGERSAAASAASSRGSWRAPRSSLPPERPTHRAHLSGDSSRWPAASTSREAMRSAISRPAPGR